MKFDVYSEVTGVLIFRNPRSGSTWFNTLLEELSDVRFGGESFATTGACRSLSKHGQDITELCLRSLLSNPFVPKINHYDHSSREEMKKLLLEENQKLKIIQNSDERHIVVGGYATPCCNLDYRAVLTKPLKGAHTSKIILYLRTNVIKIAVAVLHDDPKYKLCNGDDKRQRRLGTGHNLKANCTFFNPDFSELPVLDFIVKIASAIWANERTYRGTERLRLDYMTMYYEDLQRDTIGELKRFKQYMGIPWTEEDERAFSNSHSTNVIFKATSENLVSVIGTRLVSELDSFFLRYKTLRSLVHNGDDIGALSTCLYNMLHSTESMTFHKPCVPFFDAKDRLRGLSIRAFCSAFVTQDEIKDGPLSTCIPSHRDSFNWTNYVETK